jgi:LacI family transcriptional regulator, galactose operon repressor
MRRGDKQRSRERGTTIYDVAEAAGVSTATVSNVLRGTKYVRAELHKRVQDAIAAIDYRPNRVAKTLRFRRSRTIGVVVPDITVGLFYAIVRRIEQRAAFTDYQIILADTQEDISSERDRVRALIQRQIDGLIVVPCGDDSPVLEELRERGIPTVLLDRVGREIDFDSVSADNMAATREGTQHLISLGHRRIILLASDPSLRNIRERIEGYHQALQQAGLSALEQVLVVGRDAANTVSPVLKPLFQEVPRPTALFAVTQSVAIGTLKAIWECGLKLPADVSLLAFDDSEWFTALRPFLSTIRQPAEDFADQAWSMLMARLSNDRSPKLHAEVHCSLIIRESTGPYKGNSAKKGLSALVSR